VLDADKVQGRDFVEGRASRLAMCLHDVLQDATRGTFWRNEERWSNSPGRPVFSRQAAELYRSEYVEVELASAVARTRSQPDNQTRPAEESSYPAYASLHFRVYCKSSFSGNGILRWWIGRA
jgi:hypothetical protein